MWWNLKFDSILLNRCCNKNVARRLSRGFSTKQVFMQAVSKWKLIDKMWELYMWCNRDCNLYFFFNQNESYRQRLSFAYDTLRLDFGGFSRPSRQKMYKNRVLLILRRTISEENNYKSKKLLVVAISSNLTRWSNCFATNQLFQFNGQLYKQTNRWRSYGFASWPSIGERFHAPLE